MKGELKMNELKKFFGVYNFWAFVLRAVAALLVVIGICWYILSNPLYKDSALAAMIICFVAAVIVGGFSEIIELLDKIAHNTESK